MSCTTIAASSNIGGSTMIEDRLTLMLAMNHILGLREQTDDQAIRDLLEEAAYLLDAADKLIVRGSTLTNSNS
jgi:hypothetical protein